MKKIFKFISSRMVIVGCLIALQAVILILTIWKLSNYYAYVYAFFILISVVAVIYLLSSKDNPSYKLAWVIPILIFPIFGGLFYLLFGGSKTNKKFREKVYEMQQNTLFLLQQDNCVIEEIKEKNPSVAVQSHYIKQFSTCPVWKNTQTEYLPLGEIFWERLKEELEQAKYYIFMEYFIIEEGTMWDSILEILQRKAKEGVDVRVIYDDVGSLQTLPYKYNEKLKSMGIKCIVFNPFVPALSIKLNNRDHRKITVIDGYTGFTGGINLADEYINAYEKHGHWKDVAIMLKGDAVWNLTVMFLEVWAFNAGEHIDYEDYRPYKYFNGTFESDGYVQPYGDSPMDGEIVGENVYLNIIMRATQYVYINTPYLVVDNELVTALSLAAKSGIDIRIVTPHIEDKWYVHMVTRSYYKQLIEAGVKIYEYKPGFIHAKTFVSDDEIGVVGTINMDYRSLYLHFECGVWLYKTKSVLELKKDFIQTLEDCIPITLEECNEVNWFKRCMRAVMRIFAPLM
ncbi:MAG: cardiolipin synthase [Cellulosilyticaceae bacterium]